MRKTKIVATLGPASNEVDIIKKLIEAGINAARFNFSHGDYEEHGQRIKNLKQAREEMGAPIPIILDTKGPEIRTRDVEGGSVELVKGSTFTLTTDEIVGDNTKVAVTYKDLPKDLSIGSTVLVDDGLIELTVTEINGSNVVCRVENNGTLGCKKGVNLPNVHVNLPALTEKDKEDIKFGIKMGIDYIAASFIRSARDVLEIRKVLEENDGLGISIIAKIESRDGVDNIDEILEVSNAIMVARGDLGVEIPLEEVPIVQKYLIQKAREKGKTVITATQMLESMTHSPRPTRAEANDVANAIFDFTDAIMLSGESAKGEYPVEAVKTMVKIAEKVEANIDYVKNFDRNNTVAMTSITNAISHSACTTAHDLNAACIGAVTMTGTAIKKIAKYRPVNPILGCTPVDRTLRQLNLVWGVTPVKVEMEHHHFVTLFDSVAKKAIENGLCNIGDTMVFVGGTPLGTTGTTNTLKVGIVGDVILEGKIKAGNNATVTAATKVISSPEEAEIHFEKGDIFVTDSTDASLAEYMKKASAIIVGNGKHDDFSTAINVGKEMNIPVLTSKKNVKEVVPNAIVVTLDAKYGIVLNKSH
ncbi:MAG: pyruvate kinase [Firmicutes bacterium]|nr:pyruvate kinase [Bacillota bacterium]